MRSAFGFIVGALVAVGAACGGEQTPVQTEGQASEPESAAPRRSGLGVQQELGELDAKKTEETFKSLSGALNACSQKSVERVPFISGDVQLVVRITEAGAAKWAYVQDSTIGDRATEDCMIGVLKGATWPKPVGGEGVGRSTMSLSAGDERPPTPWTADRLGPGLAKVKGTLASCRSSAGAGPMSVTMYVAPDGKPQAIGVSGTDEKSEQAVRCVVSALESTRFPSPGSWAAKVTFSID